MAPKEAAKAKGPSPEALAALRQRLSGGEATGGATTGPTPATVRVAQPEVEAAPKPPPARKGTSRRLEGEFEAAEVPATKKVRSSAKQIDWDAKVPPFAVCWENLDRLKDFYKLTEEDTAKLLVEVVGPDPRATAFWSKYKGSAKASAAPSKASAAPPLPEETSSLHGSLRESEAAQKRSSQSLDQSAEMLNDLEKVVEGLEADYVEVPPKKKSFRRLTHLAPVEHPDEAAEMAFYMSKVDGTQPDGPSDAEDGDDLDGKELGDCDTEVASSHAGSDGKPPPPPPAPPVRCGVEKPLGKLEAPEMTESVIEPLDENAVAAQAALDEAQDRLSHCVLKFR